MVILNKEGVKINRKCVQRHMREMGICGIYPGPNLSKRQLKQQVYPYLLRNLAIKKPNEVWGIDITYIKLKLQTEWMYLVAILDWYSRYVVSWELGIRTNFGNRFCFESSRKSIRKSIRKSSARNIQFRPRKSFYFY